MQVEAVAAMRVEQNRTRSQSQQLREERDEALQKLEKWVRNFLKIAQIAFEDNPQNWKHWELRLKLLDRNRLANGQYLSQVGKIGFG